MLGSDLSPRSSGAYLACAVACFKSRVVIAAGLP